MTAETDHPSEHFNVLMLEDERDELQETLLYLDLWGYTSKGFGLTAAYRDALAYTSADVYMVGLAIDDESDGFNFVEELVREHGIPQQAIVVPYTAPNAASWLPGVLSEITLIACPMSEDDRKHLREKIDARIACGGDGGPSPRKGGGLVLP